MYNEMVLKFSTSCPEFPRMLEALDNAYEREREGNNGDLPGKRCTYLDTIIDQRINSSTN